MLSTWPAQGQPRGRQRGRRELPVEGGWGPACWPHPGNRTLAGFVPAKLSPPRAQQGRARQKPPYSCSRGLSRACFLVPGTVHLELSASHQISTQFASVNSNINPLKQNCLRFQSRGPLGALCRLDQCWCWLCWEMRIDLSLHSKDCRLFLYFQSIYRPRKNCVLYMLIFL